MSVKPQQVFETCNDGVLRALRKKYGPPVEQEANMTAMVAVALMQLSLRYFAQTGAPKAVVYDFFAKLLGVEALGKVQEKEGKLILMPPQPSLSLIKGVD
jgi:hypothetical protein